MEKINFIILEKILQRRPLRVMGMCIVTVDDNLMVFGTNVKRIMQRKSKLRLSYIKEDYAHPKAFMYC